MKIGVRGMETLAGWVRASGAGLMAFGTRKFFASSTPLATIIPTGITPATGAPVATESPASPAGTPTPVAPTATRPAATPAPSETAVASPTPKPGAWMWPKKRDNPLDQKAKRP